MKKSSASGVVPLMHRGEIGEVLKQLDGLREDRERKQIKADVERLAKRLKSTMRETVELREKILSKERDLGTIFKDEDATPATVDIEDFLNGGELSKNDGDFEILKKNKSFVDARSVTNEDVKRIAKSMRCSTRMRLIGVTQGIIGFRGPRKDEVTYRVSPAVFGAVRGSHDVVLRDPRPTRDALQ